MIDHLQERFDLLLSRLQDAYEGIGHSSGRPFLYFVYPPREELRVQRLVEDQLCTMQGPLAVYCIDVLDVTIRSLHKKEKIRQQLLDDPLDADVTAEAILRIWVRRICLEIDTAIKDLPTGKQPVVVLRNLAALHPLGNPTSFMEYLAEKEPRCPVNQKMIPVVLLVPGYRPPQTSRMYWFLSQESLQFDFYRGEEI